MKWLQVSAYGFLLLATIAGSGTEGKMTVEEVQDHLREGMNRGQVEQFFEDHDIQYGFITREQSEEMVPRFQWKSGDAVGRPDGDSAFVRIHFDLGGKRLRSNYVVLYRYRAGRIVQQELYYDPSAPLEPVRNT